MFTDCRTLPVTYTFSDPSIFKLEEDHSKSNERLYCVESDLGMVGNHKTCFCGNLFFFHLLLEDKIHFHIMFTYFLLLHTILT